MARLAGSWSSSPARRFGKVGAAVGTFGFPLWVAGICCIGGFAVTWLLLPEPNGLDLEDASRDQAFGDRAGQALQPAHSS